jgi:triosephosphate isomerase (TIM)
MSRRPCLAGNWKMFMAPGEARQLAVDLRALVAEADGVEILVFPPYLSVPAVVAALEGSNIGVGVQDVYWEIEGAFTGAIAPTMALAAGCSHTLIGHSERRTLFGETDETVRRKVERCLEVGLKAIVCVGETREEREGRKTFTVVERQVRAALRKLSPEQYGTLMLAYEPVWAIGTGLTATPAQAEEVHGFIRKLMEDLAGKKIAAEFRILYGGSVKPENASGLMACANIDGALVGGASLNAEGFSRIVQYE